MKGSFVILRHFVLLIAFVLSTVSVGAQIQVGNYKISPEQINPKPISPMIYGNFIEQGFGRQIEGMWAQKLYNPSFEIVEPFKTATWGWLGKTPADDLSK